MKIIHDLFQKRGRAASRAVARQLEFTLPGSRLTRTEIGFLEELRQMRGRLAADGEGKFSLRA